MTQLVVASRALVPLDKVPDIIGSSLDHQIAATLSDIESLNQSIDGTERSIGVALNQLSFRFPEIAGRLRDKMSALNVLNGESPMPSKYCPLTRRDKNGKNDDEEAAKMEREAEDKAIEQLKQMEDDELPPEVRKARLAMRMQKEKCKKFYAWVAQRTHPDRVKDAELNPIFYEAKAAYDDLNLQVLKQMVKDLKSFIKMREHERHTKYRDFKFKRLREKLGVKKAMQKDLQTLKSGAAWKCTDVFQREGDMAARPLFEDFVETQIAMVEAAIEEAKALYRMPSRTRMPEDLKAKLMAELFSDED